MKKTLMIIMCLGLVWAVLGMEPVLAAKGDKANIKVIMGDNFAKMQKILVNLIRSDYRSVPEDVQDISDHAGEMIDSPPDFVKKNREQFLNLAFNLRSHSDNLKIVVEILMKRDEKRVQPGRLNIDYLRTTVASHYGQMITICVACHNQFRRRILQ